ncbi:MAG: hypothetical protein ABI861_09425 [Panacibacter sp.]
MPPEKIKVGLLIDSFFVPAWIHETLKRVSETAYITIPVIVKKNDEAFAFRGFNYVAYNLYGKISRKYGKAKPKAFLRKNISKLFTNIPVLNTAAILQEKEINAIKTYGLDVLIKFGFDKIDGDILSAARLGVWAFDNERIFGAAGSNAGVWEVVNSNCSTAITLEMLGKKSNDVLYQSFSSTNISISKNQNLACWKAVSFIPRRLKELHEMGEEAFLQYIHSYNQNLNKVVSLPTEPPHNARFIGHLINRYTKWIGRKIWNRSNHEQWQLLYHFSDVDKLPVTSLANFSYKEIVPPNNCFWADPCVFNTDDGRHFIFFEELVYSKKKAHLSVLELKKDGTISAPQIVLEKPYHLSYPFVFKEGNDIYMIPETSANKTIELYKCITFPDKWEFKMNLMENLHAVDTTIHFHKNKYWMFVNIKENKGSSAWDELFLFYADHFLTGEWKAHPQNPIISDVRQSRPAGHLIVQEGKLYRPSQDCSCTYGYATNMNEVLLLNETAYKERIIEKLLPKWNDKVTAVHTLSNNRGLTVLDARYKRKK